MAEIGKRKSKLSDIAIDIYLIKNDLEKIRAIIDSVQDEEEAFDNMPENLQDSECGFKMENACTSLGNAVEGLEDIIDTLSGLPFDDVVEELKDAKE